MHLLLLYALLDFLNRFSELVGLYTFRSKIAGAIFVILLHLGESSLKRRVLRLSFKQQLSGGLFSFGETKFR